MADVPHDIRFALSEFDRSQLTEGQRKLEGDAFREAVREHLVAQFVDQGGALLITAGNRIDFPRSTPYSRLLRWLPEQWLPSGSG